LLNYTETKHVKCIRRSEIVKGDPVRNGRQIELIRQQKVFRVLSRTFVRLESSENRRTYTEVLSIRKCVTFNLLACRQMLILIYRVACMDQ